MRSSKIAAISLGLMAVISCSSAGINNTNNNTNNNDNSLEFNRADDFDIKRGLKLNRDRGDQNYLEKLDASNFKYNGGALYKGEILRVGTYISPEIEVEGVYAKNPTITLKKDDKRYKEYTSDVEGKIKVVDNGETKDVTFLDQNAVYVKLRDKNGNTKDILLNQSVDVKELPKLQGEVRYKDIKQGADNGRVRYSVLTYDDGLEDAKYDEDGEKLKINYNSYTKLDKYKDLDDIVGKKKVSVRTSVVGNSEVNKIDVDFGERLSDYRDRYEDILLNLDKSTLKFSEDGKNITGGFNPDIVERLTKYELNKNPNTKIEFITEIEDADKNTIGNHNIVRKIVKDGVTIYSKKEKAYVAFPGTTVGVVDGTFADESPEVEARMYRYQPKGLNNLKDKKPEDRNLKREHGPTVVGSMIEELSVGEGYTLANLLASLQLKTIIGYGYTGKLPEGLEYENLKNGMINSMITLAQNYRPQNNEVINKKFTDLTGKITEIKFVEEKIKVLKEYLKINPNDEEAKDEKLADLTSTYWTIYNNGKDDTSDEAQEKKMEVRKEFRKFMNEKYKELKPLDDDKRKEIYNSMYKKIYAEILEKYEEFVNMTEVEKLAMTDIHFAAGAIGDTVTGGLAGDSGKLMARMIEDNKNIKAINMSYGSEYTFDKYMAIKNMTEEEKQRAVDAYNNNTLGFRTAIKIWLSKNDFSNLDDYKSKYPGNLSIPSVLKYFESRNKIDVNDYQKLLDLKMLTLRHALLKHSELVTSNNDLLYVVSAGNSRNNSGQTDVDLTNFDSNGDKIVYEHPNRKYSQTFVDVPLYLEEVEKEKAKKEEREYKYNPNYRKNIVSVVGLTYKAISGKATERLHNEFNLATNDNTVYNNIKSYASFMSERSDTLLKIKKEIEKNPSKYTKSYIDEINAQIKDIDNLSAMDVDPNGRPFLFSFSRAGKAKLWTVASEGMYSYNKRLTEEEKKYNKPMNPDGEKDADLVLNNQFIGSEYLDQGSSFAAPRVTAVAGVIGTKFPWMSAHQIKQTIFTTATDDYRVVGVKNPDTNEIVKRIIGEYGVDENIGWGMMNRDKAYLGPARFVKALTSETGDDDFIANVPYGSYEFSNDIEGGFNPYIYAGSRSGSGISQAEAFILNNVKDLSVEEVLSDEFDKNPLYKPIIDALKLMGKTKTEIYTNILPKFNKYINSLEDYEKDLFVDAGLIKKGNGTLVLSGDNKYKDPTIVEEGTLVLRGSSESPIIVHKGAKLKLDMSYLESKKNALLDDGEETFKSKINGDIINFGELYSYSTSDRINGTYSVIKDAKTYIASFAHLSVNELNLKETNEFSFDVFRKKGMDIFARPKYLDPKEAEEEDIEATEKLDPNKKEILTINKINKKDLYKIKLGKIAITPYIDLEVKEEKITDDEENVKVFATLIRKSSSELVDNPMPNTARIMAVLESRLNVASPKEKEEILSKINNVIWYNQDDENKLSGQTLANSEVLGYDLLEIKNSKIKERFAVKGTDGKLGVFVDLINSNKFKFANGDKNIITNGFNLGIDYTSKYFVAGATLNYTNSQLFDYSIRLDKDDNTDIFNPVKRYLQGRVKGNNIGASIFAKGMYENGYISGIGSFDYLGKDIDRNLGGEKTKDISASDIIFNVNLEGGYRFRLPKNVEIEPFIGTDLITYTRGGFSEDTEYGYSSDKETNFKSKITIGTRVRANIKNKWNIGGYVSYSKYLTDPVLKVKAELSSYKFSNMLKGLTLDDNVISYGIDLRTRLNNIEFNLAYNGKNIRTQGISTGIKVEF